MPARLKEVIARILRFLDLDQGRFPHTRSILHPNDEEEALPFAELEDRYD